MQTHVWIGQHICYYKGLHLELRKPMVKQNSNQNQVKFCILLLFFFFSGYTLKYKYSVDSWVKCGAVRYEHHAGGMRNMIN